MKARVGVIVVNYNGLQDTKECLESLYSQEYENFFVVVVDNDSTEDASCLKEYEKVIYIRQNKNVGFGVANNIGADRAIAEGAEYILCLNNDTIASSYLISELVSRADENTITTAATYYFSKKDELWYGGGEVSKWKGNFQHKKYKEDKEISFVSGCCMLVHSSIYKKIGLFDPAYFMYYEDGDFSIKAVEQGYRMLYVYNARLWHKVGQSEKKVADLKEYYLTRNRLYILKKYKHYFHRTVLVYFVFSRFVVIMERWLKGKSCRCIFTGIRDYRKRKMGNTFPFV